MRAALVALAAFSMTLAGCASSGPVVQQEKYAKLSSSRYFDYEFPTVWKGIEETFRNYKVTDRDPSDVDSIEMKKLRRRSLETDWIYGQSRDKYAETNIGGIPRRINLQTRVKYEVIAEVRIGGTQVTVNPHEEVEKLNDDGSPNGYESVPDESIDPSRANEILEKINMAILSAAP